MSSKTFYAKFDSQAFLEKKYLTNLVYSKNIIRNSIDEKNKVQSILFDIKNIVERNEEYIKDYM